MKKNRFLFLTFFVLILLFNLFSCIPSTSRRVSTGDSKTTSDLPYVFNANDDDIYWSTSVKIGTSLNVYYKNPSIAYIKGKKLSLYLGNTDEAMNKTYCLVFDINLGTSSTIKQIRVRGVPESEFDNDLGIQVKKMRVDFDSGAENAQFCSGSITHNDGSTISNATQIVYSTKNLFLGATQSIRSQKASLYITNGSITLNNLIQENELDTGPLELIVLPIAPNQNNQICSTNTCQAQGYDCCIDNQCVTNGTIRSTAKSEPDYDEVMKIIEKYPHKKSDYRHIFYICGGLDPGQDDETTDTEEASRYLLYLKELYYCLQYSSEKTPDYSYCRPSLDQTKESIWSMCECDTVGELPPNNPENTCPRYGLKAYDKNSEALESPNPMMGFTDGLIYNYNSPANTYIRGDNIHNYLKQDKNYLKNYCLVGFFTQSGAIPQLRMTATPYKFRTIHNEDLWGLKINLHNANSNYINCQGTINGVNDTTNVTYQSNSVCETCETSNLVFYSSSNGISDSATLSSSITISNLKLKLQNIDGLMSNSNNQSSVWFMSEPDQIARIECMPDPDETPSFFQKIVDVPGRTAPHRFFRGTDGQEFSNLSDLSNTTEDTGTSVSEGNSFYYIDSNKKIGPVMQPYSMNAILGQMRIDLSAARPAIQIELEYDEVYSISTASGEYTPCLDCAKDKWYSGFTPFPPSQYGTGVQAINFTTSRDKWNYNLSNGNYEDTIFGRACFIPPTMIPFSHYKYDDLQTQRMTRLRTQSALYVNGYDRDWFGFNQGALIGSFNGVNWFAIGKQRRVKSTSKRLFLAINAPFADLANPANYKVHIVRDTTEEVKQPDYDFDPNISNLSSPLQNEAGSCQRFHYCESDAECVSRLGWEYMCANVDTYKSLWPTFDSNGNERAGAQKTVGYSGIIFGDRPESKIKNRCVYRGAGSPCIIDYSHITNKHNRKMFTCAPNFYCASIDDSSFNDRLKREPNNPTSKLYGQDANVLGRPEHYVNSSKTLAPDIQINLQNNAKAQLEDFSSEVGLCRPGKNITSYSSDLPNPLNSHISPDSAGRTDFISQIASCNSSAVTKGTESDAGTTLAFKRVWSCPVIGNDGNYIYTNYKQDNVTSYDATEAVQLYAQNACGKEAFNSDNIDAFKNIEATSTVQALTTKKVAQDACLRRAGAICHTNYECVPNKLHSEQANFILDNDYFGGTEAEHKFWKEYLVCGTVSNPFKSTSADEDGGDSSADEIPIARCCRPSNLPFTMYTAGDPKTEDKNPNLNTTSEGFSIKDPKADGRYSRYTVVGDLGSTEPTSTIYPVEPKVANQARPLKFQWKTFHDTGEKTCCSGWIRNFTDKTHDWSKSDRVNFDVSNFKCLNFRTSFATGENSPLNLPPNGSPFSEESGTLCSVPGQGGCSHYMGENGQGFLQSRSTIVAPSEIFNSNTDKLFFSNGAYISYIHSAERNNYLYDLAPYLPKLATNLYNHQVFQNATNNPDYLFLTNTGDRSLIRGGERRMIIKLPAYVDGFSNLFYQGHEIRLSRRRANPNGEQYEFQPYEQSSNLQYVGQCTINDPSGVLDFFTQTHIDNLANEVNMGLNGNDVGWYCADTDAGYIYIRRHICHMDPNIQNCDTRFANDLQNGTWGNEAGIIFPFRPMGLSTHDYGAGNEVVEGLTPGNDLYYLEKLARFELLGIPQIYYEPIYCNDDRNNLVPGLFNTSENTRTGFEEISYPIDSEQGTHNGTAFIGDASNYRNSSIAHDISAVRITNDENVSLNKVFSSHEFSCCQRLGEKVKSKTQQNKCCSGFAAPSGNEFVCRLPQSTNLNLYFNRYVSGEGSYYDLDSTKRLLDEDFDPQTGYPLLKESVMQKLINLGEEHCGTGHVFTGAAFGEFGPRPLPISWIDPGNFFPYGILYGVTDAFTGNQNTNGNAQNIEGFRGFVRFNDGRRWNHHIYCGSAQ